MTVSSLASSLAARVHATVNSDNAGKGTLTIEQDGQTKEYEFTLFDAADLAGKELKVNIASVVEKVTQYALEKINNQYIVGAEIDLDGLNIEDLTRELGALESGKEVNVSGNVRYTGNDYPAHVDIEPLLDRWRLEALLNPDTKLTSSQMIATTPFSSLPEAKVVSLYQSGSSTNEPPESNPSPSSTSSTSIPLVVPSAPADATSTSNPTPQVAATDPNLPSNPSPTPASSPSSTLNPSSETSIFVAELPAETPEITSEHSATYTSTSSTSSTSSSSVIPVETVVEPLVSSAPASSTSSTSSPSETPAPTAERLPTPSTPSTNPSSTPKPTDQLLPISSTPATSTSTATPAQNVEKIITLEQAKKTDARGKLTLKLALKPAKPALPNVSSPNRVVIEPEIFSGSSATAKPETTTPLKEVLPGKLREKDMPFADVIKNGNILTQEQTDRILDFSIDISAENRAKLLLDLMTSAIYVKATEGAFKQSKANIENFEKKLRSVVAEKEEKNKKVTELETELKNLGDEKDRLAGEIQSSMDKKTSSYLKTSSLRSKENLSDDEKNEIVQDDKTSKECGEAKERLEKLKEGVQYKIKTEENTKEKVLKELESISDREGNLESALRLEKNEAEEYNKKNSSSHLEQNKNKKAAAEKTLLELNTSERGAPINDEKYKKEFENQFFIGLSHLLRTDNGLNLMVLNGCDRAGDCIKRWECLNDGFKDVTRLSPEASFILGVEARELLHMYLGALHETFENKPFVKDVNPVNKTSRPFLTSLVGEYIQPKGSSGIATLHFDRPADSPFYRNNGKPYFSTPPNQWDEKRPSKD